MFDYWLLGSAMMLIVEGLLPFVLPQLWRKTFARLVNLSDNHLRFAGLSAMLLGLLLLYWIK
ncbi:MAG: DUF2065 domain-containing protein [Gallionella sp.]